MAARKLKVEKVGPKQWKFVDPPGLSGFMDEFHGVLELMEEQQDDEAEQILRKLIAACPLHLDAYHHLALLMSERGDYPGAFDLWNRAVDIGLQSLPAEFISGEDRLEWGWLENRPFLRAYHGLGLFFFETDRVEAAHVIFNHLLTMNPNDNQGIRALAVESSFAMDRPDEALRICDEYAGDAMADTLYGRPLALLQLGKRTPARKALIRAVGLFPQVAHELLKKRHQAPKGMSFAYVTVGGADEAYEYWQRMGRYWKETEGAIAFLADILSLCQTKASTTKH